MNKVILTGRLTKELVLEHTKQGTPLCQFTIATNRPVIRDGKRETDFITCIIWNKLAENLVKYQRKGNLLGIQGELRVDTYESDGKRKYKSYVLVEEVEYLESKKDMTKDEEVDFNKVSAKTNREEQITITDSDLPF
ncbi:MAG: single-stranded DNA-binding protein [Bacilli bacterium]|nr:single-stranded DNA-binding protein [Bacilli bacterium]